MALVGIGLAGDGAYHSHGDRILQALGTADGEDQLSDAGTLLRKQGQSGKVFLVDLEQSEIGFLMNAE